MCFFNIQYRTYFDMQIYIQFVYAASASDFVGTLNIIKTHDNISDLICINHCTVKEHIAIFQENLIAHMKNKTRYDQDTIGSMIAEAQVSTHKCC